MNKTIQRSVFAFTLTLLYLVGSVQLFGQEAEPSLVYHDAAMTDGFGAGKHIVFLAGDHEYRSEETLPALAKILAKHHGFKCTVLFNINEEGFIAPGNNNMPGLEALETADLMVNFLRFQNFPDEQMKHIADYIDRGGPVVGLRTATHAFKIPKDRTYARYDFRYPGEEFQSGFGRQVLGETWVSHYGKNHVMGTRLDVVPEQKAHPILQGVEKPFANCGGYWVVPQENSTILALAQPLESLDPESAPAEGKDPCPGAWVRTYTSKSGVEGRVFTSPYGASLDIQNDDFRRMVLNGCIWACGLEANITADMDVSFVGPYTPIDYGFQTHRLNVRPSDYAGWDSNISPPNNPIGVRQKRKPNPKKKPAKKPAQETTTKANENPTPANQCKPNTENVKFAAQPLSPLTLKKGDRVCLIGNELGERMQHQNVFENLLHTANPALELCVRNLCFPGDEPQHRIRSDDFGTPDNHLAHSKADVILFFFGYNESFAGPKGLKKFSADLGKLIDDTKGLDYSGDGNAPRMVLVSPVAYEGGGKYRKHLPAGEEHNKNLELYTNAMREIAVESEVGFVDLFTPTSKVIGTTETTMTLNGAHLNADGYKILGPVLFEGLFGKAAPAFNETLTNEIADKNFHWWNRHRAVNGYSIYGSRGKAGKDGSGQMNNRDVMYRELDILDQMTANRDKRIWSLAAGNAVAAKCDDSQTLAFLEPQTNVGGANDQNKKRGKLGSLDYLSAAEQQKLFKLADGYEINLVASEEEFPELANPVALNFDGKGRLWVATMESYPHWKPKSKMDDKLLIFEDDNKDGKADVCKVFAGGLHQPTGFEIGHNGVYISQQPDIMFLQDTDGDDKADTRIRKLVGFDSADSHHGIAAFTWGPGGNLYFQEGTFKHSQVESPHGLSRLAEGGIWKYNDRTKQMGVEVSFPFSNPWGFVFDHWGQAFIGDASPGFTYWATPISGHIPYPMKHPGGSQDKRAQKEVGKPKGYKYKQLYKKRIRPLAGCEIVSSRHFPDEAQGNWLVTNCIGDRMVLNHQIEDQKSGFWGTEQDPIVSCTDGNFRPVDCQFAPDGSLYIVDWHNALIGHLQHNLRDPSRDHSHGRIWRVTYKGRPLVEPPTIDGAPAMDLLNALKEYEHRTRYRAKRELAERSEAEVLPVVKQWIAGLDKDDENYEHNLLEGLWVHQTFNAVDEELLKQVLGAKDFHARAAATRVLSFWVNQVSDPLALLTPMVKDKHPRVRVEAVRALSFMKGDDAIGLALEVLDAGELDYYLQYTLDETMRALEN